MKIDKKKVVFASILVIVLIFIVSYSILVFFGRDETLFLEQPMVPELKEEEASFASKKKAIDAIKEERDKQIPSVYSEALLDSMGVYDPALEEKVRKWEIDSFYEQRFDSLDREESLSTIETISTEAQAEEDTGSQNYPDVQDLEIDHVRFFHAGNLVKEAHSVQVITISAVVNGTQTVRNNDRLELRLTEDFMIGGQTIPKNTPVFGLVTLKPNRLQINITHIDSLPVHVSAYDLADHNEGLYVRNSFREEAGIKVLDDVVQDISIPGLPQVNGIKNIFRKNNRTLKVKVIDQYQLQLKLQL